MFRSTITVISPTLTFSTPEDFILELSNYFDVNGYNDAINNYEISNKILNKVETLINSKTLTTIIDWDSEDSYNEFYINSIHYPTYISSLEDAGYIRNVVVEII